MQRGSVIIISLVVILLIFVAAVIIYLRIPIRYLKSAPNTTVFTQPTEVSQGYSEKSYSLIREEGSQSKKVLQFKNRGVLHIVKWQDWLIFNQDEEIWNYPPNLMIKAHNLSSKETKTIFDQESYQQDFQTSRVPDTVSSLIVINDILYISLGGYTREGGIYWQELPPQKEPQKLLNTTNAVIIPVNSNYLIVSGDGDSCWNKNDFYLLDPINRKTKFVRSVDSGCTMGQEYITTDSKNRMIITSYLSSPEENYKKTHTQLLAVDINNPQQETILLPKGTMPQGINTIYYQEDKNSLVLSAFAENHGTPRPVDECELSASARFCTTPKKGEDTTSLSEAKGRGASSGQESYYFNLSNDQILKDTSGSQVKPVLPGDGMKSNLDKVRELNLPPSYQVVEEY